MVSAWMNVGLAVGKVGADVLAEGAVGESV